MPRSWLNPSGNLLVVFEEWGGDPTMISLVQRTTGSVCADISEEQPTMKSWEMLTSGKINRPKAHLWCPSEQKISEIKFASYGLPEGMCGSFREGNCHAHKSYDAPQRVCSPHFYSSSIAHKCYDTKSTIYGKHTEDHVLIPKIAVILSLSKI